MTFQDRLRQLGACKEAREWAKDMTAREAWETCERGDWLLWWAKSEDCELRQLTLAKARCAKLVVHLMKDERSIKAVEVAERFGLGNATRDELDAAWDDAYAAYDAAYAAAYAAYFSAYAAYASAYASAYDAAYAAYFSAYAAYAAGDAAKKETLKKCADIVREIIKPTWI